tara:strand:+ start:80 stop:307 length:228 start_codon:yes stop_codon:yes gene_type:complete
MNYNTELMQNPNKAFEIGFKLSPELKNNVDDFMFMYATKSNKYLKINSNATVFDSYGELVFKNRNTRKYLYVYYS